MQSSSGERKKHSLSMGNQALAFTTKLYVIALAYKKGRSKNFFQLLNAGAHSGLSDIQIFGRSPEMSRFLNFEKCF